MLLERIDPVLAEFDRPERLLGAATPLLAIGHLSGRVGAGRRAAWLDAASRARRVFGAVLVAVGALIVSGADRRLEAILVDASPAWLTELTTRF